MANAPASPGSRASGRFPFGVLLLLGFATDFFDTLGIGSFATTTTALKLGRMVEDDNIPGTLNIGHAIPTILEAVIFLTVIHVDLVTLFTMLAASGIGAWYGAGIVVHWPKRTIQRGMAIALLVTAAFITLRQPQVHIFPAGGTAIGLSGIKLGIAIASSLVIGSIVSLGIGNYAPTMAVTYMLGMDPHAVFPIMATSASLMLPTAALRFYRSGRFNRQVALALAIGGVPGVWVAAKIVKSMDVNKLLWVVVVVLLYTSASLWRSSKIEEAQSPA